jgi:DNA-binding transcriptional ArsR family regulator
LIEHRTSVIMEDMDSADLVVDALAQLGVWARPPTGGHDHGINLVIEPVGTQVQLRRRALVTDDVAGRLLTETPPSPNAVLLVVGDRITETARRLLTIRGAGYYDLRGHLALHAENLVIDANVEPVAGHVQREQALSGNAGMEVATALLMNPNAGATVRALARAVGRAPSTVSEVLGSLRRDGLVDERHRVEGTQLFWRVADRWPDRRIYLANSPGDSTEIVKPLRLGLDDVESSTGWALTDSAAAVVYGAPLAIRADQLLDFFVPDPATQRRAVTLLGAAPSSSQARCAVRVAPVPAACSQRVDATAPLDWPLAHPLFVALDLARDAGRGREILEAWTPPQRWTRVW